MSSAGLVIFESPTRTRTSTSSGIFFSIRATKTLVHFSNSSASFATRSSVLVTPSPESPVVSEQMRLMGELRLTVVKGKWQVFQIRSMVPQKLARLLSKLDFDYIFEINGFDRGRFVWWGPLDASQVVGQLEGAKLGCSCPWGVFEHLCTGLWEQHEVFLQKCVPTKSRRHTHRNVTEHECSLVDTTQVTLGPARCKLESRAIQRCVWAKLREYEKQHHELGFTLQR